MKKRIKLRYKYAEEAMLKAQEQFELRQERSLESKAKTKTFPSYPPEAELLGMWRITELTVLEDSPLTALGEALDDVIIFDTLSPDGLLRGRNIMQNIYLSKDSYKDDSIGDMMVNLIEAKTRGEGKIRFRMLPERDRIIVKSKIWLSDEKLETPMTLIAWVGKAFWSGYEMKGRTWSETGDLLEFVAVKMDEEQGV